jgi:asparagine synthase (glutamine-hydrolysing)
MLRFITCAWDAEDLVQQSKVRALQSRTLQQSHWRVVLDAPGLVVMCAGLLGRAVECYQIPEQRGVVLGKLFSRRSADADTNSRVVLNADAGRRIVQSGGRYLVGNYWGEYVAFLRDSARKTTFVLQGPSAGRSVYRTSLGGAHVYFCELADIAGKCPVKLSVDWDYVAACVVVPFQRSEETGLSDVKALMGGQCDEIGGIGFVTHSYWSPGTFALSVRSDVQDCVRELGAVVRRAVHGWAGCHDRILHRLSGGLDSSIVLACLADSPTHPDVTCITYYGRDFGTDERHFARLAAQSAGCQLIELPVVEGSRIDAWDGVSPCPTPQGCFVAVQEHEALDIAREMGATAIMTGNGGDAGFYQQRSLQIAADCAHNEGLGRTLLQVINDTAALTETSVGVVAWSALRGLWRGRRSHTKLLTSASKYRSLPSAGARAAFFAQPLRFAPPAVRDAMHLPPGKFMQVAMLSQPTLARSILSHLNNPECMHPLESELVTELCLSIPTYVLCREGQARWLARAAFAGSVPSILLERATKGNPERYFNGLVDQNRSVIRERLMDGELMKEGILDRRALAAAFDGQSTKQEMATELLMAYSTEVWLRVIGQTKQQAMAA